AIWGAVPGLFLARDPLGIKPLYYGRDPDGNLLFASEMKALVPEVAEVSELPPGSYWQLGRAPVTYYQVPEPVSGVTDETAAVTVVNHLLTEAVRKRLMADVPLGLFLSGGLDSSLIAAIAVKLSPGRFHSFCVGLADSADVQNARTVARFLGTEHHELVLSPDEIIGAVPKIIPLLESCDPALVRSAIPTYFVSELAARYVKVALSGEGADELFAGYHYLREFDAQALGGELRRTTAELHNLNLQRVDRMTMAHGLEGRVPFLDLALVDAAFRLAPELKWQAGQGKWVLRRLAERYLPPEIAWRNKEKFAIGTGIGPLLERHAETLFAPGAVPRGWTPEAWWYWTVFREHYNRSDVVNGMGRSRSLNPGQRWLAGLATAD
ncbi:MAG TPA: asparagine synthase-related protein, partial [Symbiobacteriaceae bacterium]|nr:asparagine synthase-related protein [Symbiobacteriaceae bacterium]